MAKKISSKPTKSMLRAGSVAASIAPVKPKSPIKPNKNIDSLLLNAMGKNAGPVKPGRPKK